MARVQTRSYRFGDLLALARESWVRQMAEALVGRGYDGYRRTDASVLRLIRRGPVSISGLGDALGVSRQAARKVVAGLERRGYARLLRDERDGRQWNVQLSEAGQAYGAAVVEVVAELNQVLAQKVRPDQLVAADAVLRATLVGERARALAAYLVPPPAPPKSKRTSRHGRAKRREVRARRPPEP